MAEDESDMLPPSLPWRIGSTITMGLVGAASRIFVTTVNSSESHGKEAFMRVLDERENEGSRERGLITGELSKFSSHQETQS